jgi:integrase
VRKGDFAYTHEQINTMVSKANTRDKMIVLLMAATGMRIGALCTLTISNLHKMTIKGYPNSHIYKIIVYEGEPEQYYCFTTFELATAIDDYLKEREHFGEQLKPEAPLIRADYNHSIAERAQQPEFITTIGMQRLLDRLLLSCRIRVQKHKHELHTIMKSHGFRKFAITQMKLAKVDYNDREFLVGHKVSRGLDVSYDRTSEEDRLQEYLKAIELLTMSPENRLRRQVQEQDHTIKVQLAQKDQQIQELMNWKDKMEILLNEPDKFIQMLQEGRRRK